MEMNMFCHFGPNTFTGNEWGDGSEPDSLFNPTALDCRQWAAVAKAAGMKGIIVTAKHHDGFCLWPNPESRHTVRESPWKEGKGDVLRELSEACRESGLGFGVYISPWDRHAPDYGTPAYNKTFANTLIDVHTRYGDIFEQWFDGANGEGPTGRKQVYDWNAFNSTVLSLHPAAVIFSDVGPGCRWVGNEQGRAGTTCWSTLNTVRPDGTPYEPGAQAPNTDILNHGERNGRHWIPAETDVSIRPGWFYRSSEHPKSLQELLSIYYTSVGHNSLLLLNVPPDTRGLIPTEDSVRLMEFRTALDSIFAHNLAKGCLYFYRDKPPYKEAPEVVDNDFDTYLRPTEGKMPVVVTVSFDRPTDFNRIVLQEYIPQGQRVEHFTVEVAEDTPEECESKGCVRIYSLAEGTTIGYKRILCTETVRNARYITITIDQALATPLISNIGVYMDTLFDSTEINEPKPAKTSKQ